MEINQYLKELLILNDCVIIPEFGGFVANYKPASFENNQFFPPSKEIAFNNKLRSNDGLLINYIAETERTDYFTARERLDHFVEETLLNLERNGTVYFDGVGYLHYDSRENLLFEPQLKENLLAESYGLQSFTFEKIYQRPIPKPILKIDHKEPIPIIFSQRKLKKVLVAIPLLMALALIPIKNNKEYISKSDMSLWETLMTGSPSAPETTIEPAFEAYSAPAALQEKVHYDYFIIGGSFKSEENAAKFLLQLEEQGYNGQNLGVFKGLHRIAIKGFQTRSEAQKELNTLLYQNPQSGYWISANE